MKDKAKKAMFNKRYVLNRNCKQGLMTAKVAYKSYYVYVSALYDIGLITEEEQFTETDNAAKQFQLSAVTWQYQNERRGY